MTRERWRIWAGSILGYGGRILVSVLIVLGFLIVFRLVLTVSSFAGRSANARARPVVRRTAGRSLRDETARWWPRFPGSSESRPQRMVLNNVAFVSEEWTASASAVEILDFYRAQMSARGWRDVTEESYDLDPERRAALAEESLEDPRYVETYTAIVESRLVLRKGRSSMWILTEPADPMKRRLGVKIVGADTPSVERFAAELAAGINLAGGSMVGSRVLEATEESGENRYCTTVTASRDDPEQVFPQMLQDLRADNWRAVFESSSVSENRTTRYALLERGNRYACLAVAPASRSRGSSAVLTEVTE